MAQATNAYAELTEGIVRQGYSGIEVGTTMIALGMKIMKTVLTEDDFRQFCQSVVDASDRVLPLTPTKKANIH